MERRRGPNYGPSGTADAEWRRARDPEAGVPASHGGPPYGGPALPYLPRWACVVEGSASRADGPDTRRGAAPQPDEIRGRAAVGQRPAASVTLKDDAIGTRQPDVARAQAPHAVQLVAGACLSTPNRAAPMKNRARRSDRPEVVRTTAPKGKQRWQRGVAGRDRRPGRSVEMNHRASAAHGPNIVRRVRPDGVQIIVGHARIQNRDRPGYAVPMHHVRRLPRMTVGHDPYTGRRRAPDGLSIFVPSSEARVRPRGAVPVQRVPVCTHGPDVVRRRASVLLDRARPGARR